MRSAPGSASARGTCCTRASPRQLGIQIGWVVIAMSAAVVLLAWIPLRQRPGLQGRSATWCWSELVTNAMLDVLPAPSGPRLWARILLLVSGIALNAVATALYIGRSLGPGPLETGS